MQAEPSDWTRLQAGGEVDQAELVEMCHLAAEELDELVDYGALVPLGQRGNARVFSAACVPQLRHALRLRQDFDLDLFTVGLLLGYLQRIADLERQVHSLRAGSHPPQAQREGPTPWREPHGQIYTVR